MKKILLILAAMVAMSGCLVSCSDDEEPDVMTEYNEELLKGVWKVTEAKGSPFEGDLSLLVQGSQLSIFQDGIEVEDYWYEIKGGILLLTEKGEYEVSATAEILRLTEKDAKIRITDLRYGFGSYTMKLKKTKELETPTKYL